MQISDRGERGKRRKIHVRTSEHQAEGMLSEPDPGQELSEAGGQRAGQPGLICISQVTQSPHTCGSPHDREPQHKNLHPDSHHIPKTTNN